MNLKEHPLNEIEIAVFSMIKLELSSIYTDKLM